MKLIYLWLDGGCKREADEGSIERWVGDIIDYMKIL